jgi:hypothetical protein
MEVEHPLPPGKGDEKRDPETELITPRYLRVG